MAGIPENKSYAKVLAKNSSCGGSGFLFVCLFFVVVLFLFPRKLFTLELF